jgi:hypothetical protein
MIRKVTLLYKYTVMSKRNLDRKSRRWTDQHPLRRDKPEATIYAAVSSPKFLIRRQD